MSYIQQLAKAAAEKEAGLFYRDLEEPRSVKSVGMEVKKTGKGDLFDQSNQTGKSQITQLDVARLRDPRLLTRIFNPNSNPEIAYRNLIESLDEQQEEEPNALNATPEGRALIAAEALKRLSSTFGDVPEDFQPTKGDLFDLYNYDKKKNYEAAPGNVPFPRVGAISTEYKEEGEKEKAAALKALVLEKVAESAAWQRKAGKNSEGGLNAKGRASYNKSTGGNLKAPVTSKKPKGKAKKRKASFCARMGGMKKKNTSKATANDPDSRINKSLRKWNC